MKAPKDIFQSCVQYFPSVSINLVIQNQAGEFLFVKRKNNPAKGLYWVPGGRIFAGESLAAAATRILRDEVGIDKEVTHVPNIFAEEIFDTAEFDEEDGTRYTKETKYVHYLATAVYVQLEQDVTVTLDSQSSDYMWNKEMPNDHPYLHWYFALLEEHLQ